MKSILFDLDGVFYQGEQVIKNSPEVSDWVNQQSIPHLFVTNTSSKPRSIIVKKLASMGIYTDVEHIFTPAMAALAWLKLQSVESNVALYIPEITKIEFSSVKVWNNSAESPDVIIIGDLGFEWNYELMNQIFRQLMAKPETPLVALGMTRYWQAEDGLRLDIAPFIKALEFATDVKATVMGKPSKDFFNLALKILNSSAEETVMIGDDIRSDIAGAQQAGIESWLVKTGKFSVADLNLGVDPDRVLNSIAEVKKYWC